MSAARAPSAPKPKAGRKGAASDAGYLVSKVHQVAGRVFARLLKDDGATPVNPAQGRILYALWRKGAIKATELARETALEPSTLTSMLDRLESAGLLRRVPSPGDRRAVLVECTDEGSAIESRYAALSERMTRLYYGDMGEAEIAAFERGLRAVLDNLERAEAGLKA